MTEEEGEEGEEGKVYLLVEIAEKDALAIQKAIEDAEGEVGLSSQATAVKKPGYRTVPGLDAFLVGVASAFAKEVIERSRKPLANWLASKLGLDDKKGEKVRESDEI